MRDLATLAGVSVRTLHHYDQIGLLTPTSRTAAGYRQYGPDDLLRLQQILFFRELDVPLAEIRAILDDPGFDQVEALENHRRLLQLQAERLAQLIRTVDKTLHNLTEDTMTLTDEELYEGFSKEQIESYQNEARERWGSTDAYQESQRRVRNMSKAQWQAVKDQGDEATRLMAGLMGRDPADPEVQAAIARHHAWIENFYNAPAEMYAGLGQMYVDDPRFRAHYDAYAPDLADFMRDAMQIYADTVLTNR
ncbi:MAG: MerR family transcriptional regulator [Caldilineales bacterium]